MTASRIPRAPEREQLNEQGSVALDVLESLLEGCQVIGFDFTYQYVNATVARQGQRSKEQLIGRTMMECYPGIELSPMFVELRRCMADRAHHRMDNEFPLPDGSVGWFELRFVPVPEGVCILSIDITERKRAQAALARSEDQLRQAQKMEAIGRLAGGVAHDFNNMLSVIISYAGLATDALPPGDPIRDDVKEIARAGERAAELTKQLLVFSRQQVVQPKVLELNECLAGVEKMLARLIGDDVKMVSVAGEGLARVKADAGQVEQILLNLVVNARDAMPDGGKITIEIANVELDERYASEHLGTKPGPHVMLAVSDTGMGMSRETQARIFEPFFTTKASGKGTGLGLATVFGIVQQSGGSVWVYSEVGKGTTFKVYFPAVFGVVDEVEPVVVEAKRARSQATGTILVVEDDKQLRALVVSLLESAGYGVLAADGVADALKIAAEGSRRIDLLLTDVVMPEMNGRELADRVRTSRPEIKVLYMSGYTGHVAVDHGVLDQGAAFLAKPITPNTLERALREVLGSARGLGVRTWRRVKRLVPRHDRSHGGGRGRAVDPWPHRGVRSDPHHHRDARGHGNARHLRRRPEHDERGGPARSRVHRVSGAPETNSGPLRTHSAKNGLAALTA